MAEKQVRALHATNQELQGRLHHHEIALENFRKITLKSFQGLDKILPMLEEVKAGISLENVIVQNGGGG